MPAPEEEGRVSSIAIHRPTAKSRRRAWQDFATRSFLKTAGFTETVAAAAVVVVVVVVVLVVVAAVAAVVKKTC